MYIPAGTAKPTTRELFFSQGVAVSTTRLAHYCTLLSYLPLVLQPGRLILPADIWSLQCANMRSSKQFKVIQMPLVSLERSRVAIDYELQDHTPLIRTSKKGKKEEKSKDKSHESTDIYIP